MHLFIALIPERWRRYAATIGLCTAVLVVLISYHRADAVRDERTRQAIITQEREDDISDAIDAADDCADWRQCLHAR